MDTQTMIALAKLSMSDDGKRLMELLGSMASRFALDVLAEPNDPKLYVRGYAQALLDMSLVLEGAPEKLGAAQGAI